MTTTQSPSKTLDAAFFRTKFDQALLFEPFVALGESAGHRHKWTQRYEQLKLTPDQETLIRGFTREMNVLCLTGTWCGDCALQGSAMQTIADANPRINLRFILREDQHADLIIPAQINAGFRVPVTWFLAEDFEPCSRIGDRTLSRYRSVARNQARVATAAMDIAIANMREEASNLIKTVRTFAESTHDPAVFALALIPSPASGSALPAPVTPTHLTTQLNSDGHVELSWKAKIKGRMFFTIERQLVSVGEPVGSGIPGAWENRGAVPGTQYLDTAIPPGTVSANYRIATQRGRNLSVFTDPISVLLATPGTPAVSGQAAA